MYLAIANETHKGFVFARVRRGVTVWYTSRCFVDSLAFSHSFKYLERMQVSKRIGGGVGAGRLELRCFLGCSHCVVAVKDPGNF